MKTDMTEVLSRSSASLSPRVREILTAGRPVRSRNRDGEYAIILTDNRAVVDMKREHMDGIADEHADWTIVITDFTFRNVALADPNTPFFAPVYARDGDQVGTISVSGSSQALRRTDRGLVVTQLTPISTLRTDERFCEQETDEHDACIVFQVLTDPDVDGWFTVQEAVSGRQRPFELGPDYLVFRLL